MQPDELERSLKEVKKRQKRFLLIIYTIGFFIAVLVFILGMWLTSEITF
ncbi:MAG: hypothetical protein HUU54_06870 [Ignavibacteriaceae bacterium]|nr:hypothetical protein [Ignavibacteriaceae bacterium]